MEHIFRLPIGDWSGDGHSQCDFYTVKSSKSIEEVREAHFKIASKTGVNIEEIASEYQESRVREEDVEKLKELGFESFVSNIKRDVFENGEDGEWGMYSEGMAYLWIFLLMKADEGLELEIVPNPPMLSFYGFDEQKRHIGFVGYGCFY